MPPEEQLTPAIIQDAVIASGLRPLTDRAAEQFSEYAALLQRWNAKLNLSALRSPRQILERHFIESIFCAQHLASTPAALLDFGSGAGFPGIPIAICLPEITVTLAESNGKKAAFLREAARVLGLPTEVYGGRVEDLQSDRVFSAVAMRAVDDMAAAIVAAAWRVEPLGSLVLLTTIGAAPQAPAGFIAESIVPLPDSEERILLQLRKS